MRFYLRILAACEALVQGGVKTPIDGSRNSLPVPSEDHKPVVGEVIDDEEDEGTNSSSGSTSPSDVLLNLDMNGVQDRKPLSDYRGKMAYGQNDDKWNSVGITGWPCTDINRDNSRGDLKAPDGSDLPGINIHTQFLCQGWDMHVNQFFQRIVHPGIENLAYNDFIYSDYSEPGTITLSGLPGGEYDLAVYGMQGGRTNSYSVEVLDSLANLTYQRSGTIFGTEENFYNVHEFKEGINYLLFPHLRLQGGESIVIKTMGLKKVISAVQVLIPKASSGQGIKDNE